MTTTRTTAGGALRLLPARAAGLLLGAAFGAAAVLRRNKPLHPLGAVAHATWRVTRPSDLGVPVLDSTEDRRVLVRLSRAASLAPAGWDIMGVAVRLPGACVDGSDADLLFATTGVGRWTRYVLRPRPAWGVGDYTTLLPFSWPGGTMSLRLRALSVTEYELWVSRHGLGERHPGAWTPVGRLLLDGPPTDDQPIRFRPVASPPAGLAVPAWIAAVRQPAYAAARRLVRVA